MQPYIVYPSRINSSTQKIVAYVSAKSQGGRSLLSSNATLHSSEITNYFSTPQDKRKARQKIQEMGFDVEHVSDLTIRISGPASLYTQKMGVRFEKHDESRMLVPTRESAINAMNLGTEILEGVVFPQPLELHGKKAAAKVPLKHAPAPVKKAAKKVAQPPAISGTAPPVNYFHLNVPHDISRLMNADAVHNTGNLGQGVKVAMIDSGFEWGHPYFSGKGYQLKAVAPADVDPIGHGTGESANLLAVAPKVKLFGLPMDDAIASFQAARNIHKVQVISCSWGSATPTDGPFSGWDPYWSTVLAEISACVQAGIVVVFSAGNGHVSVTASSPDVISVGGVFSDSAGSLFASDYASSFRSFRFPGRNVPDFCGLCGMQPKAQYIALPIPSGCAIDKDYGGPGGDGTTKSDGWGVFSGTSAACPMVAGVVSLMLAKDSTLTPSAIRSKLAATSRDVTQGHSSMNDPAAAGIDLATGSGLVDANAAVS